MGHRVSPAEAARILNVNRSTIGRWGKNGRITIGQDGKIDIEQAQRERDATESPEPRHQARKAQFDAEKAAAVLPHGLPPLASPSGSQIEDLGRLHKLASYQRLRAQAEQANLDLDRAAKAVYERAEVEYALRDLGAVLSGYLHNLPDRYTADLAACAGDTARIHKTLEDAASAILTELNAHWRGKMAELNA